MRPISSGGRFTDHDPCERAVAEFESLWQAGEPSLERYWAALGSTRSLSVLGSLVKLDLQHRFHRDQRPSAADYLARFPELAGASDRVVSLIYEEFCLLEENGESPDSGMFCELYGPWADSFRSQLVYHRELSRCVGAERPPTNYPKAGERFANYQLRSILGIGGAARVYLATDDELGGRKVALKISDSVGLETIILANLDHRNIVPILSVAESETGLRGFCMPYRPGLTLEELIRRIGRDSVPRDARAVWKALRATEDQSTEVAEEERPGWSDFPLQGSYSEAIAWIGLALANALAYLHGRETLHRDIKPANVLLAFREGPQLLDFNLAHAPNAAVHAHAALRGGTLPYMAPEQLWAFLDPAGWNDVGASADIYALGLVLRGLLTGQSPELPNSRLPLPRAIRALHDRRSEPLVPVRQIHPGVPPALESIISKCLPFNPSERYAGASELVEDLRRFLARRPLKFASNTSLIERGVNCLYRNRVAVAGSILLTVGFTVAGLFATRGQPPPLPGVPVATITVSDLPEFNQAVVELNSKEPAAWVRARDAFDQLIPRYPQSAYPCLYHTASLEKIGQQNGAHYDLDALNKKLKGISESSDFEQALARRLEQDPRSATLLTIQATRLLESKLDPRWNEKAYRLLQTALKSDPDRFQALVAIAETERKSNLNDDAIRHLIRAIEVGKKDLKRCGRTVNSCRKVLLSLLTYKGDQQLNRVETPDGRREAASTLDQMEAILVDLGDESQTLPRLDKPGVKEYFVHFFDGSVDSGRAFLAGAMGDFDASGRGFEQARKHFNTALEVCRKYELTGETNDTVVRFKLDELDQRSRKFRRPSAAKGSPAQTAD
jgi:serine/threonine protein kinase/tetratricopeptide (TPR) repeat protein